MKARIYYMSDIYGLITIISEDWRSFVASLFPCDRIKIKKVEIIER